jgi:nitrogen-specific signal transduction histidine kinase
MQNIIENAESAPQKKRGKQGRNWMLTKVRIQTSIMATRKFLGLPLKVHK